MRSNGFPAPTAGASTTRRVLAALAGNTPRKRRQWAIGYALAPAVLAVTSLGVDGPDGLARLVDLARTAVEGVLR